MLELERSSQCGTSHVAVYASGFVHVNIEDTCGGTSVGSVLRSILATDVERIREAVRSADLGTLPSGMSPSTVATDEDVLTITSRVAGGSRKIMAFGVERLEDRDAARRFELVWTTVSAIAGKI